MFNQAAMRNLNKKPVSLIDGWDKLVISHCKSAGVEGFGHGVAHNLQGINDDAIEMRVPLTALHVVNALMGTINLMVENRHPVEQIKTALNICPQLLVYIIENSITLRETTDFFVDVKNDMLQKLNR